MDKMSVEDSMKYMENAIIKNQMKNSSSVYSPQLEPHPMLNDILEKAYKMEKDDLKIEDYEPLFT